MCSELFRIPYEWHGFPIFGVGALLAIWCAVCAVVLVTIVRRHGWSGETLSTLPILVLVGAAIVFLPRVFPDGLPVRGYGVMLLVAIVTGVGMAMHRGQKGGLNPDAIVSLAVWMVVSGIVGARLFYVVEYWDEKFASRSPLDTLLAIINIPEGGLVVFGGFVGAAVGFVAFVRRARLPLLAMADLVAPSMAIGLALGRIGCLLNGCCYGGTSDLPWALSFPKYSSSYEESKPAPERRYSPPYVDQASSGEFYGFRLETRGARSIVVAHVEKGSSAESAGLEPGGAVTAINGLAIKSLGEAKSRIFDAFASGSPLRLTLEGGPTIDLPRLTPPTRSRPVHPTQLYSAIDAGLLGWLLWAYFPFRRRDGECIALLLTIHSITRFLLEEIRTDEPAVFNTGLSISQNVSILLLAAGAAMWWYLSRRPPGVTWPLLADAVRGRNNGRGTGPMQAPEHSSPGAAKAGKNPKSSVPAASRPKR